MTAGDVIGLGRIMLGDVPEEEDTPRWSDAELVAALNRGGRMLLQQYPETRLALAGTLIAWTEIDSSATGWALVALALGEEYREALLHALAAAAHESDSADKHDREMAQYHRGMLAGLFAPPGGGGR